jgi:hypothetical protein
MIGDRFKTMFFILEVSRLTVNLKLVVSKIELSLFGVLCSIFILV